jgi:hypothetical protein
MKWQIRQIPENYEDKVISGLFYITNGEPIPRDMYFCRDGVVRSSAIPLDKDFLRKKSSFHDDMLRDMYLKHDHCAYYEQLGHAMYTLNTFKQEYYHGVYDGRLKRVKDGESTEQAG